MKSIGDILLEYMRQKDQEKRLQYPPGEPGDYDRDMLRETYYDEMRGSQDKVYEENVRRLQGKLP